MPTEIDLSLGFSSVAARLVPLHFEHGAALPTGRRLALEAALNLTILPERIVSGMEALYGAIKDDSMPPDVTIVCGQCAYIVCRYGFQESADRAAGILEACRRTLGLTADANTPDPADDPEPRPLPVPPPL